MINNDETCSLDHASISSQQYILLENDLNNEQQDTREATMWLGTDDGVYVKNYFPNYSNRIFFKDSNFSMHRNNENSCT